MWMMEQWAIHDQYELESLLAKRFGADRKEDLLDIYRANYIRERDFEIIRSFGFNLIRLPFEYGLLLSEKDSLVLKPGGLKWLDDAVRMAGEHGLYVILDLHGAPGRQSVDHTTGRAGQNALWTHREYQQQTAWLWKELASHFAGNGTVAAYDLINEPFGDYQTDAHLPQLVSLVEELYRAVREVDREHIIIVPGALQGIEFYGDPDEHGWENVAFTEHFYPGLYGGGEPSLETHARFIGRVIRPRAEYLRTLDTSFLVGEFNTVFARVGGPWMMRHYYDLYGGMGWAATMWSYKLLQHQGGLGQDNWYMVTNRDALPELDFETASYDDIAAYFRLMGTMEYAVYDSLRTALSTPDPGPIALADVSPPIKDSPAADSVPGWQATDVHGALKGGQRVLSGTDIDVYGGGSDIWGTSDQFRYLWKRVDGDFDLSVQVAGLLDTSPYAKAGLMVRNGLEPDAAHVLLHVFPRGEVVLGWRADQGSAMQESRNPIAGLPVHLRVQRKGHDLKASYSVDGKRWEKVNLPALHIEDACYVGMAVLAHDNNASLTEASFRNVAFTGNEKAKEEPQ